MRSSRLPRTIRPGRAARARTTSSNVRARCVPCARACVDRATVGTPAAPTRPSRRACTLRTRPVISGPAVTTTAACNTSTIILAAIIGPPPTRRTVRRTRRRDSGARCRCATVAPIRPAAVLARSPGAKAYCSMLSCTRDRYWIESTYQRDSVLWVTSTSRSGRKTSAKTRWSGSANDVAVYSIRAVCRVRPQPQFSARRRATAAPVARHSASTPTTAPNSPSASSAGEIAPRIASSCTKPRPTDREVRWSDAVVATA